MTSSLKPGPPATPADLRTAQLRYELLSTELSRIRSASTAWRNGLAALLAALVSFGLLRGRSDVGQLAPTWSVIVGGLLLAALLAGAVGALCMMRAAHGRPSVTPARSLPPPAVAEHVEALASAIALRRGIRFTMACAMLLVAAVGATWYGPSRNEPEIEIGTPSSTACGNIAEVNADRLTVTSTTGQVVLEFTGTAIIVPVTSCPAR